VREKKKKKRKCSSHYIDFSSLQMARKIGHYWPNPIPLSNPKEKSASLW
jgi:hypothetical protein